MVVDLSADACLLLELQDRGFFTSEEAIEICGRCWRVADRAIRELQSAGLVKKDNRPRRRAKWIFVEAK